MPDPIAPAPPPSVEIDEGSFDSALSASAPQIGSPAGTVPAAPVEQPTKPEPAPEPEKPKEDKPADAPKKKGLDALPEEKSDEKPKEDKPVAEAEEPEVDTSKWTKTQQEAFASARVAGKRLKEQVRETQTRYENLKKEFDDYKAQPRDSEATLKKLERLENWEKAQELKNTPEWIDTFEKPLQASLAVLGKIATRAKVDQAKLEAATDIEDKFDRYDAITKLFDAADEPVPAHLVSAAIQEAEKLHPLYARGMELEKKAGETLSSLKHQTEQQKAEATKAAEAEYGKHHDHIYDQISKKLPSLFSKPGIAEDVKAARPATDPADQAFQAQAAALLPAMAEELFALRDEVKKERAAKLALLGTRPGVTPSTTPQTKPVNGDDVELDEDGLGAALNTMRGR